MTKRLEVNDGRYDINLEFTGAITQQHVVRFCGDFVSAHDGRGQAEIAALEHCIARDQNRSGWGVSCKSAKCALAC